MKRIYTLIITVAAAFSAASQTVPADTASTSRELEEVVVYGEKPQVKGENGVLTVDLPSIVRDKPVDNILDALRYLPGVVNNNGMIGLAGAGTVTIILNGELTNIPTAQLYQLLSATPVDRLKTVELMYTAPPQYHVSGAVINVVLKTPSPLDGLKGELRAGYNQGHYASYGAGLAASYAVRDWAFDLNYGVSRSRSWNREETFSNHLYAGTRTMIEDDMRRIAQSWTNTIYAAASYKRLRLTYNGQISADADGRSLSFGTLGDFTNAYTYDGPVNYHNISLRYTAPFGLSAGGDYTYYGEHRNQLLSQGGEELWQSINRQRVNLWHLYADQQHRFGRWQLSYGVEYQRSVDNSSQVNQPDDSGGFASNATEDVADAYVGVQGSFDRGLSFNVSAKAEYFRNDHDHAWNIIPQLGATYFRTPASIFQLNFTTQRVYPAYWELNDRTSYINTYAKVTGNPELHPYINYSGQFSYIFRQKYVATLYLIYGDGQTVQLPYQSPDELTLVYQTVNMDYKRVAGLNLNIPFSVGFVWDSSLTANLFYQQEKAARFHDISFDNCKWVFYGALNNSFRFSANSPVALSVDFTYISPSTQGIADLSAMWKVDAGVKWRFGKQRCCEVDLRATDIFNRWSPTMTINQAGQDFRMKVRDMTRNVKLTFIWRFNGFKPKEVRIDTSRFGTE